MSESKTTKVDLKTTCKTNMQMLIIMLQNGGEEGAKYAKGELMKLAEAVDQLNGGAVSFGEETGLTIEKEKPYKVIFAFGEDLVEAIEDQDPDGMVQAVMDGHCSVFHWNTNMFVGEAVSKAQGWEYWTTLTEEEYKIIEDYI